MRPPARTTGAVVIALCAVSLTGCGSSIQPGYDFGAGFVEGYNSTQTEDIPNPAADPIESDFVNTVWSGTDSAGDTTAFEFQPDGTVGLIFSGVASDFEGDIWTDDDGWLVVTVYIDEYETSAIYQGALYDGETLELEALAFQTGRSWTLDATLVND